jgi:hypothetical protein
LAEPELVNDPVFCLSQFARCAAFDGEHIPSVTMRRSAIGGVHQRWMFMQAAAMTPAFSPGCFVMDFERAVVQTQRAYYFYKQRMGFRRHQQVLTARSGQRRRSRVWQQAPSSIPGHCGPPILFSSACGDCWRALRLSAFGLSGFPDSYPLLYFGRGSGGRAAIIRISQSGLYNLISHLCRCYGRLPMRK